MDVGVVAELWRYPVKSLGGEALDRLELEGRGPIGDRWFAVVGADGRFGSGKSTRRFRRMPGLLTMRAVTGPDGAVTVHLPDGTVVPVADGAADAAVAAIVGEPVSLRPEGPVPHQDESPVHLVTTASMRWLAGRRPDDAVDARRLRPNVVVDVEGDDLVEDGWVARRVHLGDVVLRVTHRATRCVMVALAQDELPFAPGLVSTIKDGNDFCLGVFATVESGGIVQRGATVRLQ